MGKRIDATGKKEYCRMKILSLKFVEYMTLSIKFNRVPNPDIELFFRKE